MPASRHLEKGFGREDSYFSVMRKFHWILFVFLSACIGTDHLDDPADRAILTDVTSVSLREGQAKAIEATVWYNMWVQDFDSEVIWKSEDVNIATVDQTGTVTGKSKGQTLITILSPGIDTVTVDISVIESTDEVARVAVKSSKTSFQKGETIQLSFDAYDIDDQLITGKQATWTSSNSSIVSVDSNGLALAENDGDANIIAQVDGIKSPGYKLVVGTQARVGIFQGSGSYKAKGTATLMLDANNQLILNFSDDFETSFALGTFVYQANSTSGTVVRTQGVEIAEVTNNGAKTYNISNINSSIGLNDYQYVILLCKPASITFGFAEMK